MENKAYKEQEEHEPPREPPPSYSAVGSPMGLDLLSSLSRVDIRQRNITTEHGELIFGLKREIIRKCCSGYIILDLYDQTGRMVIRFKPSTNCFSAHMGVYINGQYVSKLGSSSLPTCTPKYVVYDAAGKKVLKILTPGFGQNRFLLRLKDLQGNEIGTITKKWNGLADEIFADSNELQIDFPRDLGVPYKAAVIGFCIVIIQEANIQYQYRR